MTPTAARIVDTGSAFKVEDERGRPLAYVYYRREGALRAEYLPPEEAREVAVAIARALKDAK